MYVGFITMGADDPFSQPAQEWTEVLNNPRAYAYAKWAGLDWLNPCDECDGVTIVASNGAGYRSPIVDPAPWYAADDPDTWGFLGVIGMEVTGASDSTRQANVSMSINGIGMIGPTYMGPRTMVIRALAIARDDCSLERGLLWLRQQYATQTNPCGGDPMTYFDCCPCVCADEGVAGPCWAENYGELSTEPVCNPTWWPSTYGELVTGPPDFDEWCDWIDIYRDLRQGPPPWSCCVDDCIVPYMRQFHNARVTAGPTVIRRPEMSCGALAEIEFTIVAADPVPHSMPFTSARQWLGGSADDEDVIDADYDASVRHDPFKVVA
jgi:hypothetical protein